MTNKEYQVPTVPNQKTIKIGKKAPCDKDHPYACTNIETKHAAMRNLTPIAYLLWDYFSGNQEGYQFSLYKVKVMKDTGITEYSYKKGIKELTDKGYLVNTSGNSYEFYESLALGEEPEEEEPKKEEPRKEEPKVKETVAPQIVEIPLVVKNKKKYVGSNGAHELGDGETYLPTAEEAKEKMAELLEYVPAEQHNIYKFLLKKNYGLTNKLPIERQLEILENIINEKAVAAI